jgi:hypothetical protein
VIALGRTPSMWNRRLFLRMFAAQIHGRQTSRTAFEGPGLTASRGCGRSSAHHDCAVQLNVGALLKELHAAWRKYIRPACLHWLSIISNRLELIEAERHARQLSLSEYLRQASTKFMRQTRILLETFSDPKILVSGRPANNSKFPFPCVVKAALCAIAA